MKKEKSFLSSHLRVCMMAICLLFAAVVNAQNVTVKGNVTDQKGEPVIGATVKAEGTQTGTVTNYDGDFTINCRNGATLNISYIGFASKQVKAEAGKFLSIVLEEEATTLNEVVVTAMGIKKDAKKLGYSVSTVGAEELTKVGSPTFASAMYGKAAGVRIQTAPGGGTSSVSINVRGMSSITGTTQPLIILDGVPIRNGDANTQVDYWQNERIESNGLVDINPEDIESVSILKGAAASALYGSEAANGVVVITTKTGQGQQGVGVEFGTNLNWEKAAYMPDLQNEFGPGSWGYRGNVNDYQIATGGFVEQEYNGQKYKTVEATNNYWGPKYDGSQVYYWDGKQRAYNGLGSNPWTTLFRTGMSQQYNVAVTKAGEWGNVRFGYTFNHVDAMQRNSSNGKHNFSLNGTLNILKNVKLDFSAQYLRQNIKNRAYRISRITLNYGGMIGSFDDVALMIDKTVTSKGFIYSTGDGQSETPDENLIYGPGTAALMSEYLWKILGQMQEENHNRFIAGVTPSWEIIPGLTLRGRIATDMTAEDIENRNNAKRAIGYTTNNSDLGSYSLMNRKYETYYGDVMLMFDKTFAEKHNITANVGWSGRQEKTFASTVSTNGGLSVTNWFNLAASNLTPNASQTDISSLRTAWFGTLSYGYDNWAYVEGTLRNEKISTLAPDYNSFTYPSVNASAIVTELLKDKRPGWWDYGKIRASYGIVGNAPEVYRANVLYNQSQIGSYLYNTIGTSLGNLSLKPEKKYEFELGLEAKFLKNRAGFEISYYSNTVKDQILPISLPRTAGGNSIMLNIGELKNHGLEIAVYGTPIQTKDWQLDLRANIAFNTNKVTKLMDGLDNIQHRAFDNSAYLYSYEGQPMGDWYVYKYKRDDQGRKIIGDDGLPIRDTELSKVGNAMPKGVGGFSANLRWKQLFMDATFDFRIGGDVLNQYWQYAMETGILKSTLPGREGHGGLPYYYEDNKISSSGTIIAGTAPAGYTQFNDGMIVEGVKADGTPNTKIIPAGIYYKNSYGWGASTHNSYEDAIQDNSYLKLRELSIGYMLPKEILKSFGCQSLTVSVFARNPFYIFKNLKEMDAESGDGTNWIGQAVAGNSSAASRSFGFSLRAKF
ncbi:TonB-linked outer membrane protein, SusC/RagA family [Xylanibacter ruminicola]|uniref:TonB-linked outer membrane protein, SusC/RagA family n=1 Tax=Xylanibacter ruminicola TaxID=839 RepID=A0A1H3ZXZ6_XYLRU|nr:SusC/RagA family TonB-linked outer membrane protein [Xylanibacter ruminicola]SEA28569.1 TonB-linked outer membrane protein, SusC/RagA family [Xylanibacter ruminicola]